MSGLLADPCSSSLAVGIGIALLCLFLAFGDEHEARSRPSASTA